MYRINCLDIEDGPLSNAHGGHPDVPALDDLALAQVEGEPKGKQGYHTNGFPTRIFDP